MPMLYEYSHRPVLLSLRIILTATLCTRSISAVCLRVSPLCQAGTVSSRTDLKLQWPSIFCRPPSSVPAPVQLDWDSINFDFSPSKPPPPQGKAPWRPFQVSGTILECWIVAQWHFSKQYLYMIHLSMQQFQIGYRAVINFRSQTKLDQLQLILRLAQLSPSLSFLFFTLAS